MKKIFSLLLIIMMVVLLVSCGTTPKQQPNESEANTPASNEQTSEPNASDDAKPVKIGLVTQTWENVFFAMMKDAAEEHVKTYDNVELVILSALSPEEQVKKMEDLVAAKVDVLAVTPIDKAAIVPAIENARAQNIPVFCLDNDNDQTEIDAYIGTDNMTGGYLMGEWIIEKMGGSGEMAILEGPGGNYNSMIRYEGFKKALKDHGVEDEIKIVASVTANWKRDQGMNVANDIIIANPNLELIFSLNSEMALGAMEAIAANAKEDQVTLVGYNGVPEEYMNIYKGTYAATVGQFPELMAITYIDKAVDLIRNNVKPDRINLIPAMVVDTELIHAVVDDNKEPTTFEEELMFKKLKKFYQ